MGYTDPVPRVHQHSVVMFCHQGGGWLELGGRHTLRRGSLVQIPGWMVHRVQLQPGTRYSAVQFDAQMGLPQAWTAPVEAQRLAPTVLMRPQWEGWFERWSDQPEELLPRLAHQLPAPAVPGLVSSALALAHEAAVHGWSPAQIATRLGYTLSHLTSQVTRHTGRSLGQWVTQARLQRAEAFLRDGGTVAEAAGLCGFADLSHFRRAFKKHHGRPPSLSRGNHEHF
jgi:AraC-like DNA-binding protein